MGISPGGAPASLQVDYSTAAPFSTAGPIAIFERFFSPNFDLDGNIVIITPNVSDGFDVTTVPLPPPGVGTVADYLLGPEGSPYVGVKVLVTSSSDPQFGETALTDETGHYSVSGVPGGGLNVKAMGSDGSILARGTEIYAGYADSEEKICINPVPPPPETK